MSRKFYLAGPMSGRPQFNYPLFDRVAAELRGRGYDITSPAEMDDPATRKEALSSDNGVLVGGTCNGESWGDFLARDVKMIADELDGIILLPEWETSKGARLECFVAMGLDYPMFEWRSGELWPISKETAFRLMKEEMVA
jgi:hypothetical protein